ncbi:hypothetical protein FAES_3251 [Fibrella aestuarina BUZ 2]|uniref:Uncharacterized protein n=1 Tax=Fibrella aestuarina BUZ 2 TaxID=1166018 RepID=I0KAV7_9BACT|nr:hypothetical protein [Fibrella aestuarina]CCH01260.1 hypothetical protein FAES_3251 [Fibrella aestuarina BUZ 2]
MNTALGMPTVPSFELLSDVSQYNNWQDAFSALYRQIGYQHQQLNLVHTRMDEAEGLLESILFTYGQHQLDRQTLVGAHVLAVAAYFDVARDDLLGLTGRGGLGMARTTLSGEYDQRIRRAQDWLLMLLVRAFPVVRRADFKGFLRFASERRYNHCRVAGQEIRNNLKHPDRRDWVALWQRTLAIAKRGDVDLREFMALTEREIGQFVTQLAETEQRQAIDAN